MSAWLVRLRYGPPAPSGCAELANTTITINDSAAQL